MRSPTTHKLIRRRTQEALRSVGVNARIEQAECFRLGAPLCRYVVTSEVKDSRWDGELPPTR